METLKSLTKPLNGSAGEERSFRSFGSVPYCIGDGSLTKLTVFCCSLYSFSFLFDLCLGLCFIRRIHWLGFKGSSDPSRIIFEIKVGKSRIRHRTRFLPTLISNIKWLGPELPLNECVKWFHWNRRKSCLNMSTVISNCQIQLYSSPMVASFLIFFRRAWFYGYPAIGIFRSNSGIVASIRLI